MQKVIIWIGVLLIAVMCFFPPCITKIIRGNDAYAAILATKELEYHSIMTSPNCVIPTKKGSIEILNIDITRLILQCVIVTLLTGCMYWTVGNRKKNIHINDVAPPKA